MKTVRQIVVDTETTGLYPNEGHRIVEIGCIELNNFIPTGNTYHVYVNPQRDMPEEAFKVHGLSSDFLSDKPLFADIVSEFVKFIDTSQLVIHNAVFDMRFINYELERSDMRTLPADRAIDTLEIARRKFPGAPNSLDALCRRFEIDTTSRDLHGALIDAQLLAEVYLELVGGRQPGLELDQKNIRAGSNDNRKIAKMNGFKSIVQRASEDERRRHSDFVREKLGENALWLKNRS